ncbi:Nuclear pore complex protein Nup98-Nup96-like [Oopsacas minuta]|uniref:Nuclear pore complex protein Nup98-Nup96 n=1 Tax=Oopsacas minuta TaxID=111878 RepID=A0AAV7JZW9_9METZ|nr:Nuclear pore complex protein Nup98-Nup96-like [Oopsacas minuta]
MFPHSTITNPSVQPLTLFGPPQASTPFSMNSSPRTIFGSSNSLLQTSTANGASIFGSSGNNSIFSNSPRTGLFTNSTSMAPAATSSIFSNTMSTSNIFSSGAKPSSLGFTSQSPSGNIFQQTSIYQNSTGPGTPIPFRAVQSSDSVMKGGTQLNVQVRLECIPAMKEYENKSLEELRFEDYLAGRKGVSHSGFQAQTSIQPGIFSTLSSHNSSGKGIFNSANNSIYQSSQQSPHSASIFPAKSQIPITMGQISQGNKSISNQSGPIFGSIGLTSNSGLFPQQMNNQFSSLLPSNSNSSYMPLSNPPSVFSTQTTSNIFAAKPTIGSFNPQTAYSYGHNFNPQLVKTNTLPGQVHNNSHGLTPNSQNTQLSNYSSKPFDLALPKVSTPYMTNNSLIHFNSQPNSNQIDVRNSFVHATDPPQNLERQLLLLARMPFGDSPLFRDAKQTFDSISLEKNPKREFDSADRSLNIPKSAPPGNIFKMKIQPKANSEDIHVNENIVYFNRQESSLDSRFIDEKNVLVSRKTSVKKLELSCFTSDSVSTDISSTSPPKPLTSYHVSDRSHSENQTPKSMKKLPCEIFRDNSSVSVPENSSLPDIQGITIKTLVSALIDSDHIDHDMLSITRSDYFTVPPCSEIIQHLSPNLHLIVEEFTIIRKGFGEILFPGSTNITGLNLDQTVFIEEKEVTVYPIESLKPEYGIGLNKEAIITLRDVWPIDKSTRKPIYDPDKILAYRYYEKVEKCTDKLGAQFIDYDIETGVWKFKVDHFSKYKLIISDSSDGEDCEFSTNSKEGFNNRQVLPISHPVHEHVPCDILMEKSIAQEHFLDITKTLIPIIPQSPYMTELFFDKESFLQPRMECKIVQSNSIPLLANLSRSSTAKIGDIQNIFVNKPFNPPFQIFGFHHISPIMTNNSIICHHNNFLGDTSSILYRSFRPCWGKNGILALTLASSGDLSPFIVRVFKCFPHESENECIIHSLLSTLQNILLNHSEVNCVQLAMADNYDLFSYFHNSNLYRDAIRTISAQNNMFGNSLHFWNLISVLFDNVDSVRQFSSSYASSITSIDSFNVWLCKVNASLKIPCINNASEPYLLDILFELTKGDIDRASCIAMNHSDFHLALSISQGINSLSSKFKMQLRSQLSSWISSPTSEFISPIRIFIYGLLSGNLEPLFVYPFVDFFLSLNWLQALHLLIYFSNSPNIPILKSFTSYQDFVSNKCLPLPYPLHIADLIYPRNRTFDLYFSLMSKAYMNDIPLTSVFSVAGYSNFLLDYTTSFQILLTIFGSKCHNSSGNILHSHITMNFANQIALSGSWKFAVLILLFLPPSTHKISVINSIVERECSDDDFLSEEEKYLTKVLCFDSKRMYFYKSILSHYFRRYNQYFSLLIEANEASLAHEIIIQRFVYPFVINEELSILKERLRLVEYHGRTNQIQSWEMEGSIYLDYIRIFETIKKLLDGNSCPALELDDLLLGVRSICTRISRLKFELFHTKEYLAINEISKNLVLFLKIITTIQKHYHPRNTFSDQTIQYIIKLPLISDNYTVISNEMCDRYLDDIDNC